MTNCPPQKKGLKKKKNVHPLLATGNLLPGVTPTGPRISVMEIDSRPMLQRRDSSTPRRGPLSNRDRDKDWERDRNQEGYRGRERERSPARYSRIEDNRPERYDPRIPDSWNSYRPDYSAWDKTTPADRRNSTSALSRRSASPRRAPEHLRSSDSLTTERMPNWRLAAEQLSKKRPGETEIQGSTPIITRESATQAIQVSPTSPPTSPAKLNLEAIPTALNMDPLSAETANALGKIAKQIAVEASSLAMLKFHHTTAQRKLERRKGEFEKSKNHHDKFPDIKKDHTAAREVAEKLVQNFQVKVKDKERALNDLTFEAAKLSIPNIIAKAQDGRGINQQKLDDLTKTLEGFKELLERQQNIISTMQEQREKDLENREKELNQIKLDHQGITDHLQEELHVLRSHVHEKLPELDAIKQEISQIKGDSVTLKSDFSRKAEEHSDLIRKLSNRTSDWGDVRESLNTLKASSTRTDDRVIEMLQESSTLSTKILSLEQAPDPATKNDLDILVDRVARMEAAQSSAKLESNANSCLAQRVTSLEQAALQLQSLTSKVELLEDNGILGLKKSDVEALVDLEKAKKCEAEPTQASQLSEEVSAAFESRISALENDSRRDLPPGPSPSHDPDNTELRFSAIWDKISKLESEMTAVFSGTGDLINEGIAGAAADVAGIKDQLASLSNQQFGISTLNKELDSFRDNQIQPLLRTQVELVVRELQSKVNTSLSSITDTFNIESKKTANIIEAITDTLDNLRSRFDNLNTTEVVKYMLGQLSEMFPGLQNTEATIQSLRVAYNVLEERINTLSLSKPQQDHASPDIEARWQDLRTQVDNLNQKLTQIELAAEESKKIANDASLGVAKLVTDMDKDKSAIVQSFDEYDHKLANLSEKINKGVEELTRKVNSNSESVQAMKAAPAALPKSAAPLPQAARPQAPSKRVPTTSRINQTPTANPPSSYRPSNPRQARSGPAAADRSRQSQPAHRQGSVASVASSDGSNKKRKHPNGHDGGTRTNGFNDSNSNTPEPKKSRPNPIIKNSSDEDLEDSDDAIPQPQPGSDDDDE